MVIANCVVKKAFLCIMAGRSCQGEALTRRWIFGKVESLLGDNIYCLLHSVWASSRVLETCPELLLSIDVAER